MMHNQNKNEAKKNLREMLKLNKESTEEQIKTAAFNMLEILEITTDTCGNEEIIELTIQKIKKIRYLLCLLDSQNDICKDNELHSMQYGAILCQRIRERILYQSSNISTEAIGGYIESLNSVASGEAKYLQCLLSLMRGSSLEICKTAYYYIETAAKMEPNNKLYNKIKKELEQLIFQEETNRTILQQRQIAEMQEQQRQKKYKEQTDKAINATMLIGSILIGLGCVCCCCDKCCGGC